MRYIVWVLAYTSWDASFQALVSRRGEQKFFDNTAAQGEFISGPALHLVSSSATDLCPQRIWLEALIAFLANFCFPYECSDYQRSVKCCISPKPLTPAALFVH